MAQPEDILRKQCEKIAAEENLTDYDVEIIPVSSDGANYMSVNFRIKIIAQNLPNLNLFAKVAIFSEAVREQLPVNVIYEREITAYTKVLAAYEILQEKCNIPNEDKFTFAKYYGSSLVNNEECMILEDMTAQGYTMYDRFKAINWEYAARGIEQLAKFHALSLAFNKEFPNELQAVFGKDDDDFDSMYQLIKISMTSMSQLALPFVAEDIRERLQFFLDEQFKEENFRKYYSKTSRPFIIHGDYRASNILFKRKGGKVTGFVPVDFQGLRLGSPSVDILYFIYCGTDAEFRRLHLKNLLNRYYETFSRFLRLLNLNPEEEFSRQDFDEDYKRVLGHGLITATTVLPIVLIKPTEAPKFTGNDVGDITTYNMPVPSDEFKKRFMDVVNEYTKYGIV